MKNQRYLECALVAVPATMCKVIFFFLNATFALSSYIIVAMTAGDLEMIDI